MQDGVGPVRPSRRSVAARSPRIGGDLRRALPDRSSSRRGAPGLPGPCAERSASLRRSAGTKRSTASATRSRCSGGCCGSGARPTTCSGPTPGRPLRLRIASPWDWRQDFRFLSLEVIPASAGQPQVDWVGTYETKATRGGRSRSADTSRSAGATGGSPILRRRRSTSTPRPTSSPATTRSALRSPRKPRRHRRQTNFQQLFGLIGLSTGDRVP